MEREDVPLPGTWVNVSKENTLRINDLAGLGAEDPYRAFTAGFMEARPRR
jgi:hypothetical protein